MILLLVFLASHVLLAYNSSPMARSLAIIFDHEVSYRMEVKSLSRVQLSVIPWTLQSMEFSQPEYWSR